MNIFLIGPMGAGKTTIGRQLARRLNFDFYDSDREIEKQSGVDIATIFEFEGERGFRNREVAKIDELTKLSNIVLATGGGAILREENRDHLRARGQVIFLDINLKEQLRRTRNDKKRPLLQTENVSETLQKLRQERFPIYHSLADFEVKSSHKSMRFILQKVLSFCQAQQPSTGNIQSK